MDGPAEPVLDLSRECLGRQCAILGAGLLKKGEDLVGNLVAAVRPPLLAQQTRKPALLKGPLRLIKRGTREMEGRGGGGDRLRLDLDASEHFVLDLHDVAPIEKWVRAEHRVGDLVGPAVQGAVGT